MPQKNNWLLPIAIVVAGAIIAVALYYVRVAAMPTIPEGDLNALRPLGTDDHIVGNPEALVTIVEYSDIDCEYCKNFQATLEQVMTEYAAGGEVAWVYRHFPVVETHPDAAHHAAAAECAASIGTSDTFFRFIDALNQSAPDSAQFDPRNYGAVATSLGLSPAALQTCIDSKKYQQKVMDDFDNAIALGAAGTPFSVVLIKGHDPIAISGALPYDALKKVIENALKKARN